MSQKINRFTDWRDLYFFESKLTTEILDRIKNWEEYENNKKDEMRYSEGSVVKLHSEIKKLIQNH